MQAQITQADIPGLFNVWIPSTEEMLYDLTTGQVEYLLRTRDLIPL